jgi:predicted nucleic acid-binding Zn ribbon protein
MRKCNGSGSQIKGYTMENIFDDIRAERQRQNEKYGEQNLPMLGTRKITGPYKEIHPSKDSIKKQLQHARQRQRTEQFGWFDVLVEEVCEAFLETEPKRQRKGMIHVAAVAVQIIEYMDRRTI